MSPEIRIVNAGNKVAQRPSNPLSTEGTAMKEDRKIKNVVLIMLDTLQFNYLGCYGNKVVKTLISIASPVRASSSKTPTVKASHGARAPRPLMTASPCPTAAGNLSLLTTTTVADIMWGKNMQTALVYDTPPMRLPKYGYSLRFRLRELQPWSGAFPTTPSFLPMLGSWALKPEDYTSPRWFSRKRRSHRRRTARSLDEIGCFLRQQQFRKPEDSYISRRHDGCPNWLSNRRDKTRPFPALGGLFDPGTNLGTRNPVCEGRTLPLRSEYVGNPLVLAPWTPIEGRITERECEHIRALYMEKDQARWTRVGELLDSIRGPGALGTKPLLC